MNRFRFRRRQIQNRNLNKIIRNICCWNCFQVGHKRFQCPYPKINICSFCRRPGVLSVNCECKGSKKHFRAYQSEKVMVDSIPNYNPNVEIPILNGNEVAGYEEVENLMVVVDNENEDEYLELHAESDSLEDL